MANQKPLLLYEKNWYKQNYKRVTESLLLILLLLLLGYRVISVNNYSFPWFVAFLCESWFTISWFLTLTTQWSPAEIKTYPDRLLQSVQEQELPPVDLFVTTADPLLEPPIITVNTVLSLLALDYPPHKLACYVSDDGCSPLTFYALQEASQFAKFWVPFCKKYDVQVRAPLRYFSCKPEVSTANNTPQFKQEWLQMKDMYDNLSHKIELDASQKSNPCHGEFDIFSNTERTNHPTIIQVIWENKEGLEDGLSHLIYISREKRPNQSHHFKAGAMNVLYLTAGIAGLQGPFYGGTNCLLRRKVIYGNLPNRMENGNNLSKDELEQKFGDSKEIMKTATHALEGKTYLPNDINISIAVDIAAQVASCGYEHGTSWGKQVGWIYGSITEDKLLGLKIHEKGWRSELCTPNPIAFTGFAPGGGPNAMAQQKRWAIGLLEIFFSKHCPIFGTIFHKLTLRQCLAYMWIINYWGLKPLFEVCYACLLSHSIITNSTFLPMVLPFCCCN
ncbi:cellulose synthase-like protein B4 isoform X2 [Phaseolus vulgaris]|uniref:cellulose synthase-like protein B4 isoform X2 n=1 Tax=Phaseolus vulgaris TaxID=3885 RepID=UPI0035C9D06D